MQQLRYFIAVTQEGSLRAAARSLYMSQPPLSLAMQRLERELGVPLLLRSQRGIDLTDAGAALLVEAHEIVSRFDAMRGVVREAAGATRETLRVGLVGGLVAAADLTVPIIEAFRSRYPDIRLELRDMPLDRKVEDLASGEVDVAIERPPYEDERLEWVPLFSETRVLCVRSDHELAGEVELPTEEVLEVPMVEFVTPHPEQTAFWSLDTVRGGRAPVRSQSPGGMLTSMQLALVSGHGATTAALSAWRLGLQSPLLHAIQLPDAPPSLVSLAYGRDRIHPGSEAFIETAQSVTRQLIGLVPGGRLVNDLSPQH